MGNVEGVGECGCHRAVWCLGCVGGVGPWVTGGWMIRAEQAQTGVRHPRFKPISAPHSLSARAQVTQPLRASVSSSAAWRLGQHLPLGTVVWGNETMPRQGPLGTDSVSAPPLDAHVTGVTRWHRRVVCGSTDTFAHVFSSDPHRTILKMRKTRLRKTNSLVPQRARGPGQGALGSARPSSDGALSVLPRPSPTHGSLH